MKRFLLAAIMVLVAGGTMAQDNLSTAIKLTQGESFDAAKTMYENLIAAEPTNGDNYFYYGENFLAQFFADTVSVTIGDVDVSAKKAYEKGIEVDPENPLCYVGLAKVALLTKDTSAATWLNEAFSKFPSRTNKTSTLSPEKQALTYAKAAEALIQARVNATSKALEMMDQAVALDSKNPEIYLIWGDVYMMNNEGSNAKAKYNIAQELDPNSPAALLRVGKLWVRAQNWNDAIDAYNEAIKIDPNFAPAYVELGAIYLRAGQNAKAKENFEKYLQLSSSISAKVKYLFVLWKLGEYDAAIPVAQEILKIDPNRHDIIRTLAYCYYETKNYQKATEYIELFFQKVEPEKIMLSDYEYHGDILSKSKQDSLAILEYKKVLDLDTSRYDMYTKIADAYRNMRDFDNASIWYEKKIPTGTMNAADYYKLGMIYYNTAAGNPSDEAWAKADTTFAEITNTRPDFQGGKAYLWRGRCNVQIDLEMDLGLANQYYENYINIAVADSVKNARDLIEAYDYFQYYYLKNKDYCKAKYYVERILWTDPDEKYADIPKFKDLLNDYTKNCQQ